MHNEKQEIKTRVFNLAAPSEFIYGSLKLRGSETQQLYAATRDISPENAPGFSEATLPGYQRLADLQARFIHLFVVGYAGVRIGSICWR